MDVKIDSEWKEILDLEFTKEYFLSLVKFLKEQKIEGKVIFPPGKKIFNALNICTPSKVKVIILGQDPYHGPSQANGLSFSVPNGIKIPPSLLNIFKEIENDIGEKSKLQSGDLTNWGQQGILLLNSILTVEKNKPASHRNMGWELFTDAILHALNKIDRPLVFILWGSYARSKRAIIINPIHLVIESAHPSPFSAHHGFFGSKPFSRTNNFLMKNNITQIVW